MSDSPRPSPYPAGLAGLPADPARPGILARDFGHPPMSVLSAREGDWQRRKRAWVDLGIRSELGRTAVTYNTNKDGKWLPVAVARDVAPGGGGRTGLYRKFRRIGDEGDGRATGTSIFDPVLAEVVLNWWCPPGGVVLDPFAGGSVRGIVCSVLGRKYWGCDLRGDQVAANYDQLTERTTGRWRPRWVVGEAAEVVPSAPAADFLLTCPPYGNLERYSGDPRDLSAMKYEDCLAQYAKIIAACAERLRPNRFAVFVVGNFRDRDYRDRPLRDFVGDTIRAAAGAGLVLYNEIILVTAVGSACIRARGSFARGGRKVVRTHQQVLCFVKGDPLAASAAVEGGNNDG